MNTLKKLKAISLKLRINRDYNAPFISYVISEIELIGKNDGNRASTEDEAIRFLKKTVNILESNLQYNLKDKDVESITKQIEILKNIIPTMLTAAETEEEVRKAKKKYDNIGQIMNHLKEKHGEAINLKLAVQFVK